jgi:hypothetical protein
MKTPNAPLARIATLTIVTLCFVLAVGFSSAGAALARQVADERPVVQLAILLDTSSSMSGLINQARAEIWSVVNELAKTRRHGKRPRLEVALYEYGKSSLSRSDDYIQRLVDFTTDLDHVSERLFALSTNGGDEYCGAVIDRATRELDWSDADGALKIVVIAGNEPFTQGPKDYKSAVRAAIARGVVVNTIHCGSFADGVSGRWQDAARLADGSYAHIDHNRQVAKAQAPQDAEIKKLDAELNQTYVGYGKGGAQKKARQAKQDKAASGAGQAAAVERAAFKASGAYQTEDWDLVDAVKEGKVDLEAVEEEALPEPMRAMSRTDRTAHVKKLAERRREVQARIKTLAAERDDFLKQAAPAAAPATLGAAVIQSVKKQAAKQGYEVR